MIKSCHDWFPRCHGSAPWINLDLSPSSNSVAPSRLCFAFSLSLWLCTAPRAHLKYLNAVGHCLWSAGGALAQADVWIPTASDTNVKNVLAVSAVVLGSQSRKGKLFFREVSAKSPLTPQSSTQLSSASKITETIYDFFVLFNPSFRLRRGKRVIVECVHVRKRKSIKWKE